MGYKLYSHDGSGGFVVEAALVKARVPHEVVVIDTETNDHVQAEFTQINPMRQVPALVLPDGTVMTESAAATIHLSCVYPDRGLAGMPGSSEHAQFLRWMVFASVNLYEGCLRCFYSDRYTADAAGADAVAMAGGEHMQRAFDVLEAHLANSSFLCGSDMSMADVYLAMLMKWAPEPVTATRLCAVAEAVAADETVGPIWRRHGF